MISATFTPHDLVRVLQLAHLADCKAFVLASDGLSVEARIRGQAVDIKTTVLASMPKGEMPISTDGARRVAGELARAKTPIEIVFDPTMGTSTMKNGSFKARLKHEGPLSVDSAIVSVVTPSTQAKTPALVTALIHGLEIATKTASRDQTRPSMTGVNLRWADGTLVAESTDGHTATVVSLAVTGGEGAAFIPNDAMQPVLAVLNDSQEASWSAHSQFVMVLTTSSGSASTTIGVVDGSGGAFPDISRVVPKTFTHSPSMKTADAVEMLRSIRVVASKLKTPIVHMRFKGDRFDVGCSVDGIATGQIGIQLESAFDGDGIVMGVNADYLERALSSCGNVVSTLKIIDARTPLVISDVSATHVIMPSTFEGTGFAFE